MWGAVGLAVVATAVAGPGGAAVARAAQCREVTHELGTACVPKSPKRVVVLDPLTTLPTLIDLGVPVVGSMDVFAGKRFPSYLEGNKAAEKATPVGEALAVNLELVAAARPDLVIGSTQVASKDYDKLSGIAPTVVTKWAYYEHDWQDVVRQIGAVVGKPKAVEKQLAKLDKREAALRRTFTARGEPFELSRVDVYSGMPLYYKWDCLWFGQVLGAVGITQPAAQDAQCTPSDARSSVGFVSPEQFALLDGDAIYAYQQAAGDPSADDPLPALEANPLWKTLQAVKDGRVVVVDDAWGLGASVRAANSILDDLEDQAGTSAK